MKKSSRQHKVCILVIFDYFRVEENNPVFNFASASSQVSFRVSIYKVMKKFRFPSALNRPLFGFPVQSDEQL